MWTYKQALKVMECWVDQTTGGEGLIDAEATITKPYGWVFFYRPKSYFQSKDFKDVFIGAGPVIFDKLEGEISVFGSGQSIEKLIKQYERSIPRARRKG